MNKTGETDVLLDEIALLGMRFYGYHGAYEGERQLGQRFIVSLWLSIDLRRAGEADDLGLTVNYADVYAAVQKIVEGEPKRLLEALAERIAQTVLGEFPLIRSVVVEVEKPGAPIPGVLDTVRVRIYRKAPSD
ncbi:dihydroneopterin aldolase [Alicyclobacillus hesperidum]|uniref:7,8-dihydroneopterin aldolase n=1 Tax=Alicyclobacillus hesperidum TaxID=89784 RepID=A0AA37TZ13_9BACL|nr:dihydroneopterin aldolase [Alicyclobacillus hesperidum]